MLTTLPLVPPAPLPDFQTVPRPCYVLAKILQPEKLSWKKYSAVSFYFSKEVFQALRVSKVQSPSLIMQIFASEEQRLGAKLQFICVVALLCRMQRLQWWNWLGPHCRFGVAHKKQAYFCSKTKVKNSYRKTQFFPPEIEGD